MRENARRFLRQKLGSVGTLIALGALGLLVAFSYASSRGGGFTATLAAFVIGGGIVSRDIASGAMQMILVRPVRRVDYLLGRFAGAALLFTGFLVCAFLAGALLDEVVHAAGWASGGPTFVWKSGLELLLADWTSGLLALATLLFLSTFLRGVGDVIAFMLAALVFGILPQIGQALHSPALVRIPRIASENLSPKLPLDRFFSGQFLVSSAGAWPLAFAAYLLLACLVFNRREFSYGTD